MSEMKVNEKKVVGRNVAIALGIVCIILVAGLVGGFGYFMLAVNDRNNTISTLNTQYYRLYSNWTNLRDQVNDLKDTLNLHKWEFWTHGWATVNQSAGSYSSWNFSVPYAGEILVQITPFHNDTWIRVLWNCSFNEPIQYDYQTYGWTDSQLQVQLAAFPVLPTSIVEIRVGNTLLTGEIQFLAFITYYY